MGPGSSLVKYYAPLPSEWDERFKSLSIDNLCHAFVYTNDMKPFNDLGNNKMTLRLIIMIIAIVALIIQFILSIYEDREKKAQQAQMKRIDENVKLLVAQGKIAPSDAQILLSLTDTMQLHDKVEIELKKAE